VITSLTPSSGTTEAAETISITGTGFAIQSSTAAKVVTISFNFYTGPFQLLRGLVGCVLEHRLRIASTAVRVRPGSLHRGVTGKHAYNIYAVHGRICVSACSKVCLNQQQ
jgi:hypothetical protein